MYPFAFVPLGKHRFFRLTQKPHQIIQQSSLFYICTVTRAAFKPENESL